MRTKNGKYAKIACRGVGSKGCGCYNTGDETDFAQK